MNKSKNKKNESRIKSDEHFKSIIESQYIYNFTVKTKFCFNSFRLFLQFLSMNKGDKQANETNELCNRFNCPFDFSAFFFCIFFCAF